MPHPILWRVRTDPTAVDAGIPFGGRASVATVVGSILDLPNHSGGYAQAGQDPPHDDDIPGQRYDDPQYLHDLL
jgi:hypothetical protein